MKESELKCPVCGDIVVYEEEPEDFIPGEGHFHVAGCNRCDVELGVMIDESGKVSPDIGNWGGGE